MDGAVYSDLASWGILERLGASPFARAFVPPLLEASPHLSTPVAGLGAAVEVILFVVEVPMARYKYIDTNPRTLAVDLARELLPGTFEHALSHRLEHELDVSHLDARFRNDATGAPAYPPATY